MFAISEVRGGSEETSRQDDLPAMRNDRVSGNGMGTRSAEDFITVKKVSAVRTEVGRCR